MDMWNLEIHFAAFVYMPEMFGRCGLPPAKWSSIWVSAGSDWCWPRLWSGLHATFRACGADPDFGPAFMRLFGLVQV